MKPIFIARQGRLPSGLLGHIVARVMARETAPENDQTLSYLDLSPDERILEIGYGHGRTLGLVARAAKGIKCAGIDFSEVMMRVARARNRNLIRSGALELRHGDSANMPWKACRFDKVFSVHTVYFWNDIDTQFKEIGRVLRPNGCFLLCYRPGEDEGFADQFPQSVYTIRTIEEIEAAFRKAGFERIETQTLAGPRGLLAWTSGRMPQWQEGQSLE